MSLKETHSASQTDSHTAEMTRGQWQAGPGSELFGQFYNLATEQRPPTAELLPADLSPGQSLVHIGLNSAIKLADSTIETPAEGLLIDHANEIAKYTGVAVLASGREYRQLRSGIRAHVSDGLKFAHTITMGAVVETMRAAGYTAGRGKSFRCARAILRNREVQNVLYPLMMTGFGVLGTTNTPRPYTNRSSGLVGIIERLTEEEIRKPIQLEGEVRTLRDFCTVRMSLDPMLVAALRSKLAAQNKSIAEGQIPERYFNLMDQHNGRRGFSSGCPVAHNDYTLPRMQWYLAETIRKTALCQPIEE